MRNATVKWFDKGYGFLVDSETKEDVFVHYSNLIMDGYKALHEDDMVTYELGTGKDGREQAINVHPVLTMQMIEDSLKEENLYIQTLKDVHKVTKYLVVDADKVIKTSEQGMDFLNLAAYAGYDTEGLSE